MVANLRDQARELARDAGQPVSGAAVLELEATLEAALADDAAAEALRSGRLTAGLRYSGLGLTDVIPAASSASRTHPAVPSPSPRHRSPKVAGYRSGARPRAPRRG